jgi:hypothetical protein
MGSRLTGSAGRAAAITLLVAGLLAASGVLAGGQAAQTGGLGSLATPAQRALPRVLAGVTTDDVSDLGGLVASSRHLPVMPATRLYFDVTQPPRAYAAAVRALHPVSYLMGELLDSSDETSITTAAYKRRVSAYLAAFGASIDIWEIGNEVNGDWTGPYPVVAAKLTAAYRLVAARHLRTALTLYENAGCGDGPGELSPMAFSRKYVPVSVRDGLSYVFLSYYEDQCGGRRPSVGTWTAVFRSLHALYPRARVGFGEIGLDDPVTTGTIGAARSLVRYYYGLPVRLPYYAGGYFWWYYAEDCVPYATKPLWRAIRAGFLAERAVEGSVQPVLETQ